MRFPYAREVPREQIHVERALSAQEVSALVEAGPAIIRRALVRPPGASEFARVVEGAGVAAGSTLVVYRVAAAELAEINRAFESRVYTSSLGDIWPDERALIEERLPPSGARVLEVCCGNGRVAPYLVYEGNRVVAVDRSRDCVAFASATDRAGVTYLAADACALPFGDRAFDTGCVFENSLGVLFDKQVDAVKELVRVTRKQLLLGFRTLEGDRPPSDGRYDVYTSREGFIEIAETFTPEEAEALLGGMSRIREIERRSGERRPWGGREHFLVAHLDWLPKTNT